MSKRLQSKIAIVTGASRGIGQAIALEFAAQGANVVIASRKQAALDEVASQINAKYPNQVLAKACHIGKTQQIDKLIQFVEKHLGIPNVLVNNAATNPYFGPMVAIEESAYDKTFEVNIKGPFEVARRVANRWIETNQPGSMINISSVAGVRAAPFQGVYGMTKAALISMTQTLAYELGEAQIRVNAVAPGLIETRFAQTLIQSPEMVKHFTDKTALKRYGQPEEIAGAVVFLASDESSFMTGQTVCIDAGYTIV